MRLFSRTWWVIAVVFTTPLMALIEKTEERVLATGAAVRLELDLTRGKVSIEPVEGATDVRLTIRRAFATTKEEDVPEMQRRHELEFTQTGGVVKLRSRYDGEMGPQPTWIDWPPVDFSFELQVPKRCAINVIGRRVDAIVGPVQGDVRMRLDAGEVSLQQIDGSVDVLTKSGNITLASCSGAVKLVAKTGAVFVGPVQGETSVVAGGGDAEVQAVAANTSVHAVTGDVKVAFAGNFVGEAKLTTDGGNVTAIFDPEVSCVVDAATFWGHVENKTTGLVLRGTPRRGRVEGVLGHGGSPVVLRAGGGHVFLKTNKVGWEDARSPAFASATPSAGR